VRGGPEFTGELEHAIEVLVVEVDGRREQALAAGTGMLKGLHGLAPRAIDDRDGGGELHGVRLAVLHEPHEFFQGGLGIFAREILNAAEGLRPTAWVARHARRESA
jgi:hypothetical protein